MRQTATLLLAASALLRPAGLSRRLADVQLLEPLIALVVNGGASASAREQSAMRAALLACLATGEAEEDANSAAAAAALTEDRLELDLDRGLHSSDSESGDEEEEEEEGTGRAQGKAGRVGKGTGKGRADQAGRARSESGAVRRKGLSDGGHGTAATMFLLRAVLGAVRAERRASALGWQLSVVSALVLRDEAGPAETVHRSSGGGEERGELESEPAEALRYSPTALRVLEHLCFDVSDKAEERKTVVDNVQAVLSSACRRRRGWRQARCSAFASS